MPKYTVGDEIEFMSGETSYSGVVLDIRPCLEETCKEVLLEGRVGWLHAYECAVTVNTPTFEVGDLVRPKGFDKRIPLSFCIQDICTHPDIPTTMYKIRTVRSYLECGWWKASELESVADAN